MATPTSEEIQEFYKEETEYQGALDAFDDALMQKLSLKAMLLTIDKDSANIHTSSSFLLPMQSFGYIGGGFFKLS